MKKLLTIALVVMLACTMLPFAAIAEEEPVTIKWAFSNYTAHEGVQPDTGVYARINKQFGVVIEPQTVNFLQNSEQFNMLLASGEIPDVWYDWAATTWYEQGMTRTITLDMIKENMPYLWENLYMKLDPDMIAVKKRMLDDGTLIGVPSMTTLSSPFFRVYRADWLETLGLQIPTTIEEFEEYLEAVATMDPDGNGVDDTYGFTASSVNRSADITGAYGIPTNFGYMLTADGTVINSWASEMYKNLITKLNEWYEAGWVPKEMMTLTEDDEIQMFATNKLGSFYTNSANHDPLNESTPEYALLANEPDVKFALGTALEGPDGARGAFTFGSDVNWTLVFGLNTSDEVVAKVLNIIDTLNSPDGFLTQFLAEGDTYKVVDSQIVSLLSGEDAYTIGQGVFPLFYNANTLIYAIGTGSYYDLTMHALAEPAYVDLLSGWSMPKTTAAGIGQDIGSVMGEFYWNSVLGINDINTDWDAYIKTLEANGLRELEEEANEIYETKIK